MVNMSELKKGATVYLKNGWKAIIMDNARGQTRICQVFGLFTEMGSIYISDIASAEVNGQRVKVIHSEKTLSAMRNRIAMGF